MEYVLASASPRRRELLPRILGDTPFRVQPAVGEEPEGTGLSPAETVRRIAAAKAEEVSALCGKDDVIIAADTLVFLDDMPLGKPRDSEHAANMLRALSGRSNTVWSGIAVRKGETLLTAAEATEVFFRRLEEDEIAAYVASGEPLDKAGAYGIQGGASVMISGISGDYYNAVGLPLCRLWQMLRELHALPGLSGFSDNLA